jgi:uncharacterized protein
MHLVITARREDRLRAVADEIRDTYGIRVGIVAADLSAAGEAERLWHAANAFGPIDLLVNNAGFGAMGRFHEVPLDRHLGVLQVNCTALMELAHLAVAEMRERGRGGIINVASIAAYQPVPKLAVYAATKAFVLSLSEALWAENRSRGIRVLALCPGRTPTEFQEVAGTGPTQGSFGVRTPEQVVDAGLRAFERDRSSVVPGLENRVATWLVRALPRGLVIRLLRAIIRTFWKR